MKNLHLVPINVQDICEKLFDKNIRENEHQNYLLRVEAIREYCDEALRKNTYSRDKQSFTNRKKIAR